MPESSQLGDFFDTGGASSSSGSGGGILDWFNSNGDALSGSNGVSVALGGLDALAGLPPGTIEKITDILLPGFVDKTLGSVFANGMDWSCWNSASNPAEQKVIISVLTNKILEDFKKINLETGDGVIYALNSANRRIEFEIQYKYKALKRRSWAKCTEKAWWLHVNAFKKLRNDLITGVLNTIVGDYNVGVTTIIEEQYIARDDYYPDYTNTTAEKNGTFTYDVYSISTVSRVIGTINKSFSWVWFLLPFIAIYLYSKVNFKKGYKGVKKSKKRLVKKVNKLIKKKK